MNKDKMRIVLPIILIVFGLACAIGSGFLLFTKQANKTCEYHIDENSDKVCDVCGYRIVIIPEDEDLTPDDEEKTEETVEVLPVLEAYRNTLGFNNYIVSDIVFSDNAMTYGFEIIENITKADNTVFYQMGESSNLCDEYYRINQNGKVINGFVVDGEYNVVTTDARTYNPLTEYDIVFDEETHQYIIAHEYVMSAINRYLPDTSFATWLDAWFEAYPDGKLTLSFVIYENAIHSISLVGYSDAVEDNTFALEMNYLDSNTLVFTTQMTIDWVTYQSTFTCQIGQEVNSWSYSYSSDADYSAKSVFINGKITFGNAEVVLPDEIKAYLSE